MDAIWQRLGNFPLFFGSGANDSMVFALDQQAPTRDALTGAPFIVAPDFDKATGSGDEGRLTLPRDLTFGGEPTGEGEPSGESQVSGKLIKQLPHVKAKMLDGQDSLDASKLTSSIVARGGNGEDTIIGSNFDDVIFGNGHNDSLTGLSGDDTIDGGNGKDSIDGGDGDDCLIGGDGKDTIAGGNGNDEIDGGAKADTIRSGAGNDVIITGSGPDNIVVGKEDLGISGKPFTDRIKDFQIGGENNDILDLRELGETFIGILEIPDGSGVSVDIYDSELSARRAEETLSIILEGTTENEVLRGLSSFESDRDGLRDIDTLSRFIHEQPFNPDANPKTVFRAIELDSFEKPQDPGPVTIAIDSGATVLIDDIVDSDRIL